MQKHTIQEMKIIAKEREGECLSKEYINAHTKLKWRCRLGHVWEAKPYIVIGAKNKKGTWCPFCSGNLGTTVKSLMALAKERGGKFKSKKYTKSHDLHDWECANGHIFKSSPSSVKSGRWCPECSIFMGERFCRILFESFFKVKFPKSYPKWLRSKNGTQLELDGYNSNLKIAFEHHGNQHYKFIKKFHKNLENLKLQQERDLQKRLMCEAKGVTLIEIPEIQGVLSLKNLKDYVLNEIDKTSIRLVESQRKSEPDYSKAYIKNKHEELLKNLEKIVIRNGGMLITEGYLGSKTLHKFKCKRNHLFEMIPNSVKSGQWCPICAGCVKGTIDELIKIITLRGGKCISYNYKNSRTKIEVDCGKGHMWKATPTHLKRGHWCPKCAKNRKLTIEDLHKIASSKGGKYLAGRVVRSKEKGIWQCEKGHQWEAQAGNVLRGAWCPQCRNERRASMNKRHWKFEKAKNFILNRMPKIKSTKEFRAFVKTKDCPEGIPSSPEKTYKNTGWKSWGDWLGKEGKDTINSEQKTGSFYKIGKKKSR